MPETKEIVINTTPTISLIAAVGSLDVLLVLYNWVDSPLARKVPGKPGNGDAMRYRSAGECRHGDADLPLDDSWPGRHVESRMADPPHGRYGGGDDGGFFVIRGSYYRGLKDAEEREDWAAGAVSLNAIRRAVGFNLALGIAILTMAGLGRYIA